MKLRQSLVKSWESTSCKRLWQAEATREIDRKPNEYMLRGLYFEQLCIGASAGSNEAVALPRLRSGEKSVAQIRIESQAERFRNRFDPDHPEFMGWTIGGKQLLLESPVGEGTLDFVSTRDNRIQIWDIKSTEDATNELGWGNPKRLDFIQQGFYKHLYLHNFGIEPELFLYIADYSPKEVVKVLRITISDDTMERYLQRFKTIDTEISELEMLDEFPRIPEYHDCKRCPLSCKVRAIAPGIDYHEITV